MITNPVTERPDFWLRLPPVQQVQGGHEVVETLFKPPDHPRVRWRGRGWQQLKRQYSGTRAQQRANRRREAAQGEMVRIWERMR